MKIKTLVTVILSLLLVSCGNNDELKDALQTEYDRINKDGNSAFCYFVGNLTFPYTEETIAETEHKYDIFNKKELMVHLPLFTDLGLLQREKVSSNPLLYRYDVTEKGKAFHHTEVIYNRDWVKNESYFCFGRRVIQEITDVKNSEQPSNMWGGKYTRTKVEYTYLLENLPEWAKSEELYKVYNSSPGSYTSRDIFPGVAYLKKENGAYYNDGGVTLIVAGHY